MIVRWARFPTVWSVSFCGLLAGCASAPPPGPYPRVITRDVRFALRDDGPLALTLFCPDPTSAAAGGDGAAPATAERRPVLLLFHGGAFRFGHRSQMYGAADYFARQGFVAAAVSYRLAPRHPFPAAIQDAVAAVRFVRRHSEQFGGDPQRIGVLGMSAGAYLAMMVAYCDDPDRAFAGPAGECGDPAVSSRVQAVVNMYGPSDLVTRFDQCPWWLKPAIVEYVGRPLAADRALWQRASPIHYLGPAAPPTLSLHGRRDQVVGFEQSVRLDMRLAALGVPHALIPVEAGHGWGYYFGTADSYAWLPVVTAFLVRHLSPPPSLASAAQTSSAPTATPAALDDVLEPIRARCDVPGLAAVILQGDRIVARGATGLREVGRPERVSLDDRFHLGSCTKAMTATLIALLVERGTLSWSTTVADAFPELRDRMAPDWRDVTVEQLLAHRGGAPANLDAGGLWARLWTQGGAPMQQRMTLVEAVTARPPEVAPGSTFVYSNAGYAIAGAMVERIAGRPWEELMGELLFEPLAMTSAGFGAPGDASLVDQPRGHVRRGGANRPVPPGPRGDNPVAIAPGNAVHCSLPDWSRFVAIHLAGARGQGDLLTRETFERLHAPPAGGDYALGWAVRREADGRLLLTHSGSNTMWMAVVRIDPQRNRAVLVACNAGPPAGERACIEAGRRIEAALDPR